MADVSLLLGPPGTGKTTRLLGVVESELAAGVRPERMAFVSFTRKAAQEAVGRALIKFDGMSRGDFPHFRTLHSLAYRELGLRETDTMRPVHWRELGTVLGTTFAEHIELEEGLPTRNDGDRCRFIEGLARAKCANLRATWAALDEPVDWFALKQYADALARYKADAGLTDFPDMLDRYPAEGAPLDVDVAIIDEAQDLSAAQWRVARHAFKHAKRLYIAGDDDQCIYSWNGADIETFLSLRAGNREVLGQSYRLPRTVAGVAARIISRVRNRYQKRFEPRPEMGEVHWLTAPEDVNLAHGSWLLLARNGCFLPRLTALARGQGVVYQTRGGPSVDPAHARIVNGKLCGAIPAWERLRRGEAVEGREVKVAYDHLRVGHGVARGFKSGSKIQDDAAYTMAELKAQHGLLTEAIWHDALAGIDVETREYYLSVLRSGRKLSAPPTVTISTVHGAKGGEADNVLLMTDMAGRTWEGYQRDADSEHRVFYVGATRAKQRLFVCAAGGTRGYSAC